LEVIVHRLRTFALVLAGGLLSGELSAQTNPTLPAMFYEVEAREILGFGRAATLPANGGVNIATNSGRLNSIGKERERMFSGEEFVGAANFTVTADTVFWRAGPNDFRIPVRSIVRIEEVSRTEGFGVLWAKIVYRFGDAERNLFVRRFRVERTDDILAALRAATELAAAAP
jgi:hypothetical protein